MLLKPHSSGVSLRVRVTPRGGADKVEGAGIDADGHALLRVRVSAVAEKGKANDAVLKLLAKTWRLPRSSFAVVSGDTGRNKIITIEGDTAHLTGLIDGWLQNQSVTPAT